MLEVMIFGASDTGKRIYEDVKEKEKVIGFVDYDPQKWGGGGYDGIPIDDPAILTEKSFDKIYIGVLTYYQDVVDYLKNIGIPEHKIVGRYVEIPTYARIECLKNIGEILVIDGIQDGNVAELGVFRGDFAGEINKTFPDKKLYLFDTFEGFAESDTEKELASGYAKKNRSGYFSNTSEEIVMEKMRYPEQVEIRKGFFPQTAEGLEDRFCFVNLDADLYAPTIAGLRYFYPRMVDGGIILVHDYFSKAFTGAREAVREFALESNCKPAPIGDTLSVIIRK